MNYDKISFRPNEEQQAFLERLNQRYRCRTVTDLMRKLLDEIMTKENSLQGHSGVSISKNLRTGKNVRLTLKDTRLGDIFVG
jgi:hypothetical protein